MAHPFIEKGYLSAKKTIFFKTKNISYLPRRETCFINSLFKATLYESVNVN